jgi:hypothetical protein
LEAHLETEAMDSMDSSQHTDLKTTNTKSMRVEEEGRESRLEVDSEASHPGEDRLEAKYDASLQEEKLNATEAEVSELEGESCFFIISNNICSLFP